MGDLPARLASLIGREGDIAEIRDLLSRKNTRLVTLTGVGGCGKTRLALEVAAEARALFTDGVCLVELAPVTDPALVPTTTLAALEIGAPVGLSPLELLRASLASRDLLLVLDNCEHLIDACAHLAESLLRACPSLRVLATSREPLRIPGERAWRVRPLPVPGPAASASLDELVACPSVRLFIERAQAAVASFQLTPANAPLVARVCARLDGIPLAVELAAARVRVLSVAQILARLDDCFPVLVGGHRTAPLRHQTMQATLDWSYDLLRAPEQAVFRRLAVFVGSCDLEAAEAVCAGESVAAADVLEIVTRLVDQSLVIATDESGMSRFRLLEPVRQYAARRLVASEDAATAPARHTAVYFGLAERAARGLHGPDQITWLARLEREQGNLRAVLRRAAETVDIATSLRLATFLTPFWETRCHLSEGRRWLESALDRADGQPGSPELMAWVQCAAGRLAYAQARYTEAVPLLDAALARFRALNDQRGIATALTELGMNYRLLRQLERSTTLLEDGLARFRALADRPGMALALLNLGITRRIRGETARSRPPLEESLALFRAEGDLRLVAITLTMLGWTALQMGDPRVAAAYLSEALAIHADLKDRFFIISDLLELAAVLVAQSRLSDAVQTLGAASAIGEMPGDSFSYVGGSIYDSLLATLRARLDAVTLSGAWDFGHAMSVDQAVSLGLTLARAAASRGGAGSSPGEPAPSSNPLTPREREVVTLIANGWHSDRQIAERLVLTRSTAGLHVQNILAKLGLHSRWEIGEWAAKHGKARALPHNRPATAVAASGNQSRVSGESASHQD